MTTPKRDRGGRELFRDLEAKERALRIDATSSDRALAFCASGLYVAFDIDRVTAWSSLYTRYPAEVRFGIFALYERCAHGDPAPQEIADEVVALYQAVGEASAPRALLRRVVIWRLADLGRVPATHPWRGAAKALDVATVARGKIDASSAARDKALEQLQLLWFAFLGELDARTRRDQTLGPPEPSA